MNTQAPDLADRVMQALRGVLDPELGHNIVDLGMVYQLAIDDGGAVRIVMTTTVPGCPASSILREGVGAAAAEVDGVTAAEVIVTFDPPWSPDRMAPEIKSELGFAPLH
jgi:metal-sulfur cluster biosynthetic enzyme